jgi:UDP-N-acetylmuramate-alanine ligase
MSTPEATAEIARRASKREASGKWTVAAAKSQGREDIVAAKMAHTFTRTTEKVAPVAPKATKAKATKVAKDVPAAPSKRVTLTVRTTALEAKVDAQGVILAAIAKKLGL